MLSYILCSYKIYIGQGFKYMNWVSEVTEKIFKIGSMEPGAMLFEASKEFYVSVSYTITCIFKVTNLLPSLILYVLSLIEN